ncbi:hypothetical protein SAMN04488082_12177 [Desulfomicrobium apsheronum]|uniref:Uncharacterized protein n=1 Tax=Desulfomicrobium apsheronum TaxID=52560 RepID=A0A1I3YXU5_9BACT|nr:hypothetical protein [Desulfomicrobium apsheronum]SFK36687.1 hypothetical protein SAMN04488082_12177 [Desulfomicrobium apsheronum]
MQPEYVVLLKDGFEQYLKCLDSDNLQPSTELLPFDFDFLKGRKWHAMGEWMVSSDLRELTNLLNGWSWTLVSWHAWNNVMATNSDNAAWEISIEFVESKAHECLLKPSSIRDTFTSVVTNALHQARLSVDGSYEDHLEGDPTPERLKPLNLSRKQKEKRLFRLASFWPESREFLDALEKINTERYTRATYNYRNLNSHTIGPSLGRGYTRPITRAVVPADELVPMSDGTFKLVTVPGKMVPSYGFGGLPPLDLEQGRIANLEQYELARACYLEYRRLLESVVSQIPMAESAESDA